MATKEGIYSVKLTALGGKELEDLAKLGIELEGDHAILRQQAKGALPNGTIVEKAESLPNDDHQDGALATIIGSLETPRRIRGIREVKYLYCVRWHDDQRPVFVLDYRLKERSSD